MEVKVEQDVLTLTRPILMGTVSMILWISAQIVHLGFTLTNLTDAPMNNSKKLELKVQKV